MTVVLPETVLSCPPPKTLPGAHRGGALKGDGSGADRAEVALADVDSGDNTVGDDSPGVAIAREAFDMLPVAGIGRREYARFEHASITIERGIG